MILELRAYVKNRRDYQLNGKTQGDGSLVSAELEPP